MKLCILPRVRLQHKYTDSTRIYRLPSILSCYPSHCCPNPNIPWGHVAPSEIKLDRSVEKTTKSCVLCYLLPYVFRSLPAAIPFCYYNFLIGNDPMLHTPDSRLFTFTACAITCSSALWCMLEEGCQFCRNLSMKIATVIEPPVEALLDWGNCGDRRSGVGCRVLFLLQ